MGKHIALLCMSLNIGGAETHIFELAKGLTAQGNTVTVFSNGGVYADALEKAGIRHIKTPLHRKNPYALIKSYCILRREFKKNPPSVIHSHTRISNFVGGLICKRLNIPLVTTVHFNFKSSLFFRWFSNWGCRALAVSEDLKTYLVDNYHYDPKHVALTVNGIDMDRFHKHDESVFRTSLGIQPQEKMILLVSRLDKEASIHVSRFLEIAPAVYKNRPDIKVVIVGDGKLYPEFVQKVTSINQQCGKEFILLQGARTNIEQYTASADLFVGISRSALEAMSSEIPTILLGNLGYLGLYSDKIKEECIETNLTCRGYPYPSNKELIELVLSCLKNDLTKEIEDGLRLVREHFSISIMAETALQQYKNAIDSIRPLDYMISGYYGTDNFGDNLTLSILMDHLKGYNGTVLTHNIKKTPAPDDVFKVHRFHLWTIRKQMKKTKVFLLGSGSILQDSTSNRSIFYYHYILQMALRHNCKVMLYANGIGPIKNTWNRKRTTKLLNQIELITARDEESIKLLKKLNIHCPTVLTADDVFSLRLPETGTLTPVKDAIGKTIVGVNFKLEINESEQINKIAAALTVLAHKYRLFYYLIPFHQGQDLPALRLLHCELPGISYLVDDSNEIIQYIQLAEFQIFERFHGQVIATKLGTPFLPINYDPKNHSLACQMGMEEYLIDHKDITKENIINSFDRLWQNRELVQKEMTQFASEAENQAKTNRVYLLKMIEDF